MSLDLVPRLGGAQAWKDDEPLECVSVVPEGPNTVSFSFRAPSGAWFDYRPGQFLTLELPVPGGPIHRTYTLSSSPSRPLSITLTVRAQNASVGTRWMLDSLREGMRLKAIGPGGIFVPDVPAERKLLLISAGSGVTPMMAITTYRWDLGGQPDICFVECARSGRASSSSAGGSSTWRAGCRRSSSTSSSRRTIPTTPGRATAASSTS